MRIIKNHTVARAKQRGVALIAALFAAAMTATLVAVMFLTAVSGNKLADVDRYKAEAQYMASGAVEAAKKEVQTAIANWEAVPAGGTVSVGDVNVNYTIEGSGLNAIQTDAAGIQTIVTGYEVQAIARSGFAQQVAHRLIKAEATPIFQFAVFYTDDLEIFPGPSMTLGGRVHTNADMFVGCGGTLSVDTNYMRSVGGMQRNRKDNPLQSSGTVKIRKWVENPYDPSEPVEYVTMHSQSQLAAQGVANDSGYDSNFTDGVDLNGDGDFYDDDEWLPWGPGALENWAQPDIYAGGNGNTVMNGAHGVSEAVVPSIGSIAMYEEQAGGSHYLNGSSGKYEEASGGIAGTHNPGFFHDNADLSIITYDDGSWDAFDGQGLSVKASLAGIVTQTVIFDARQANGNGENTPVTQIDIDLLNSSGVFPTNGLLYASHYEMGEGTDAKGIKLVNGAEIHDALTVVSEGSVYVQGDYNTVNKVGASVIGDGVNLLSNSWDDTKAPGTLPVASDTTYNLAIVTGNHETVGSKYNGGLENLPRFHEAWSSKDCNINGSFVCTWQSLHATGKWKYGSDRYKAPRRNWAYDPMFNQVANLPPFTPMAVSAKDIVSW